MSEDLDVADVLERAAEVIETRGWCQGRMFDPEGRLCLIGALDHAAVAVHGVNSTAMVARIKASKALIERLGVSVTMDLALWNDRDFRTEGDVTDLLKHTAKDIRNGEVTV